MISYHVKRENKVTLTRWIDDKSHHEIKDLRLDLANHSPDGFEFGYAGSGPAQLALVILSDYLQTNDPLALTLYQDFKREFIAPRKNTNEFVIPGKLIQEFIKGKIKC